VDRMIDMFAGEGADGSPKSSTKERDHSKLSSPSFAPRGQPKSRSKFRQKLPPPLQLAIPQNKAVDIIHNTCSVGTSSDVRRQFTNGWGITESC
jgi:hypothetical protein